MTRENLERHTRAGGITLETLWLVPRETLTVFFSASLLLALAPGPDNLFVVTQAALRGWWAGWVVTLGLCTGLLFHTAAVAFGIAAIFQTSALAFTALKLVGAGYLLFLAWKAFRAPIETFENSGQGGLSFAALYRRGIIMNITNPKVSIFFLAFLPQFADPSRGSLGPQIVLLGAVFMLAALLVFGAISLTAGAIGRSLQRTPTAQLYLNRLAGVVFTGLACKLAFTRN